MSTNTPNLGLLKKDTTTDGLDTFNIETMLNENWDKIDVVTSPASAASKGVVKIGLGINVNAEGVISVPAVSIPVSSVNNKIGAIELTAADVGAATISQGVIAEATADAFTTHQATTASQTKLAHVKVDGASIKINSDGTISSGYFEAGNTKIFTKAGPLGGTIAPNVYSVLTSMTMGRSGSVRIVFDAKTDIAGNKLQIFSKDLTTLVDTAISSEITTTAAFVTYTVDVPVVGGDLVTIKAKVTSGQAWVQTINVKVKNADLVV